MARLGDIQIRGDGSDPKQIMNYLYQLEEQIRYALAHLGSENIQEGSIDTELLGPRIKQNIQNINFNIEKQERKSRQLESADGKLRTLIVDTEKGIMVQMDDLEEELRGTITATAQRLQTDFEDALGNYSTIRQTADAISTYVANALGNYSTIRQTADAISTYVANALGDYSTSRETADAIALYVGNNAYGKVSGIGINANGISMTGSQYIQMASGYISIGEGFTAGAGRTQILALDVFSSRENGYIDVTGLLEDLDWYGWIRNASVSGDTLTLTKSNGRTVTFTPSGGGGSGFTPSYGLQQLNNILNDATWSTTSGKLTLYLSGNYTVSLAAGYHDAD